jgi:hypothetical protein
MVAGEGQKSAGMPKDKSQRLSCIVAAISGNSRDMEVRMPWWL